MQDSKQRIFDSAEWIWVNGEVERVNEYADFLVDFDCSETINVNLNICAKSDYVAFINGKLLGFNQYRDFPDLKVYDSYNLNAFASCGKNTLAVRALSKNYDSSSHIANGKGIIFEIVSQGEVLVKSDFRVLSRISPEYKSGKIKNISSQLGMSYFYDFSKKDDFIGRKGFTCSKVCDGKTVFTSRPVKKMDITLGVCAKEIKPFVYDLERECSGYLCFIIEAKDECKLTVSYGEHLTDGCVRRRIHDRDFSAEFKLKKGINEFNEYFTRFGLRYIELSCDGEITVEKIGINKCDYPLSIKPYVGNAVSKEIYYTGINTLINCMHEHYEDCPWREQAMYAMDSRNQMLCGYYAFEGYEFPRAALKLMIHRLLKEGLPITSPSSSSLSIGSFSLVYFLALKEYVQHSKDVSLVGELLKKTDALIDIFISKAIDGLLPTLRVWNFFEWSEGLHNESEILEQKEDLSTFALPLSAFFVVALNSYSDTLKMAGYDGRKYTDLARITVSKIEEVFYDPAMGLYATYYKDGNKYHYSQYANTMALYCGCSAGKDRVLRAITSKKDGVVELSLSNYIYKYEVLMYEGGYEDYILSDISEVWGKMLKSGATSFWETALGEADFNGAGSLCHGWSAIPVYVAHKLQNVLPVTTN